MAFVTTKKREGREGDTDEATQPAREKKGGREPKRG